MTWYYKNSIFTEDKIDNYVGFIYIITDLELDKKYIGQKVFWNKITRKPLKGKKNRRISRKQSNWQEYFGSNDVLNERVQAIGSDKFKREIIRLCKSKSEMNYFETYEIFRNHALIYPDKYYNSWCSARINRNQLKIIAEEIDEY